MEKKNILVVDDEPDVVELLKYRLEFSDFNVITAKDGLEAIKKINEKKPDLVVLDIMMPKLDGFEILKRIKFEPEKFEIPVIILSAKAGFEDIAKALDIGAVDYITKPFSGDHLIKSIEKALQKK